MPPILVDYSGQEEYIWAMRTRLYSEDADDWKDRRISDTSSTEYEAQKPDQKGGIASSDEYNTKVLASLVPDEIIFDCNDYTHRPYDACLLFGDVSGRFYSLDLECIYYPIISSKDSRIYARNIIKPEREVRLD